MRRISLFLQKTRTQIKSPNVQKVIAQFFTGQILVQFLGVLTGFLLLRWLSIEHQAKYSFAFGIQTMITVLGDAGFGGSIISLVGSRINDRQVLGNYISAARYFKNKLIPISSVVGLLLTLFLLRNKDWSIFEQVSLYVPIVITAIIQGSISYYRVPLQLHKEIGHYYFPQIVAAVLRLAITAAFFFVNWLTVEVVLWTVNIVQLYVLLAYKKKSARFFTDSGQNEVTVRKEMVSYLKPLIPIMIFNAFYGQISLFLVTVFGQVAGMAQMGALGRFGQIFQVFATFDMVVVAPFIAKSSTETLLQKYLMVILGACVLIFFIIVSALLFPNLYLWLLGPKYSNLQYELQLFILSLSIGYLEITLYAMNVARKWIFRFNAPVYIGGLLLLQIYFIRNFDLQRIDNVIITVIISTSFILLLQLITAIIGFWRQVPAKGIVASNNFIDQKKI